MRSRRISGPSQTREPLRRGLHSGFSNATPTSQLRVLSLMRDWEGKSIYIEIYRDIDIYTGNTASACCCWRCHRRRRPPQPTSEHLHFLCRRIEELAGIFFSRKNKTKHHDRPPYLVPNPQPTPPSPLSDKSKPDHGDCRSTPHLPWCCAPQREWGTRSQRPAGAHAHAKENTRAARHAVRRCPREEGKPPPQEGGGQEHWGVIFWVWALGHRTHLPLFHTPFPSCHLLSRLPPHPHRTPLPTPPAPLGPGPAEDHR